jgi:prepilin-type N-terminal cleavage/methylation domain-containing protein
VRIDEQKLEIFFALRFPEGSGMRSKEQNSCGFTILELVVAIAIAAIMAGFAVPSIANWQHKSRLRGAAVNLVGDLEMAKIRAIRENSSVAVLFNAESYSMFVDNGAGGGTAGDWVPNGDEALILYRELPAGVTINLTDLTPADDRLRFNGRGQPPDVVATETIPLQNKVGRKNVTLNRLGTVRIQ